MLEKYRAVFFDAGGTLLHPYPSVGEIYAGVAARYGCMAPASVIEPLFREAWLKRDGGFRISRDAVPGDDSKDKRDGGFRISRDAVPGDDSRAERDGLSHPTSHASEKVEREWWRSLVHEVFTRAGGVSDFETFFGELYDLFARPEVWRLYPGVPDLLRTLKKKGKILGVISNWDSRLFPITEGLAIREYFDFVLASAVFGASKPGLRIFEEALKRAGVAPSEAVHIGDSYEDDIRGARAAGLDAILIERHPKHRTLEEVVTIHDLAELLGSKS